MCVACVMFASDVAALWAVCPCARLSCVGSGVGAREGESVRVEESGSVDALLLVNVR